ncbi:hypothetical protein HHO41_14860 [Bacillus sp. DNRA2]|uniref:hypothetical protein n=1 Tax=Bacillus sp. DNRA2 TaxID=2723053 RepID=UPI00145C9081|nr:hypothetical protein [Bacillus sp. DNRA2]NMD71581.1 hypothetical protein [Bacillus sp. DNRA2]
MKKFSVLLFISLLLLLTSCSDTTGGNKDEQSKNNEKESIMNNETEEKEDLTLQLQKGDEEAGLTIENSEIYQMANDAIKGNPKLGNENAFTMYLVDSLSNDAGEKVLLFLAINRSPESMKNVTFDFTVGNENAGFVWNKLKVTLPEKNIGTIQSNGAVPIIIPISKEKFTTLSELKKEDQEIKLENFKYEIVE